MPQKVLKHKEGQLPSQDPHPAIMYRLKSVLQEEGLGSAISSSRPADRMKLI